MAHTHHFLALLATSKYIETHRAIVARQKKYLRTSVLKLVINQFQLAYIFFLQQDQSTKDKALQSMAAMSSAQIVSATAIHNKAAVAAMGLGLGMPGATAPVRPPYSGASVSRSLLKIGGGGGLAWSLK